MEPVPSKARGNSRPWRSRARKWPLCVSPHTRVTPLPHCLLSLRLEEKEVARNSRQIERQQVGCVLFPGDRSRKGREREFSARNIEIFQRTPGKHFRESETLSKHKGNTDSGKHLSRVLCVPSFPFFFFFSPPPVFPLFDPGAEEFKAPQCFELFLGTEYGRGQWRKVAECILSNKLFFRFFFFSP